MRDLICSYYTTAGAFPAGPMGSPLDFAVRVEACAEAGYAGIGMHVRDYQAMGERGVTDAELKAILTGNGIRHVELEFFRNWHLRGAEGRAARRDEESFYRMADLFGARVMFIGGDLDNASTPIQALAEPLRAICERALRHGLDVAIEPCVDSNVEKLDEALELLALVGAKNAGLCLDVWHSFRANLDYYDFSKVRPGLIKGVQIDDVAQGVQGTMIQDCVNHRLLPGEGDARPDAFLASIFASGYDGPVSVEIVSREQRRRDVREAAQLSYDAARATVDKAGQLLAKNDGRPAV